MLKINFENINTTTKLITININMNLFLFTSFFLLIIPPYSTINISYIVFNLTTTS